MTEVRQSKDVLKAGTLAPQRGFSINDSHISHLTIKKDRCDKNYKQIHNYLQVIPVQVFGNMDKHPQSLLCSLAKMARHVQNALFD